MSVQYGNGLYENLAYAQRAAIDDFLSASGTQKISDGINNGDTPESIAVDMIYNGWTIPGLPYAPSTAEDVLEDMAACIARRLDEHGIELLP